MSETSLISAGLLLPPRLDGEGIQHGGQVAGDMHNNRLRLMLCRLRAASVATVSPAAAVASRGASLATATTSQADPHKGRTGASSDRHGEALSSRRRVLRMTIPDL